MMTAGVVVVTYNSADVIGECLDACARFGVSALVVDNASIDGTADVVRSRSGVRLIANAANVGFGAAVNQGIAALGMDLALILNPDATLQTPLAPLMRAAGETGVGAVAGRLVDSEGRTQHGFTVRNLPSPATLAFEVLGVNRLWPGNPVNRTYRIRLADDVDADVEQPAGAFLMVSRKVWEEVGRFDEGFHPIWFEDVDFCKRVREAGYRIRYVPQVTARHIGGHSADHLNWGKRQVFWYGSLLRYAARHYGSLGRLSVSLAVLTAAVGRMLFALGTRRSLEPVSIYSRVFWLAWTRGVMGGRIRGGGSRLPEVKENKAVQL